MDDPFECNAFGPKVEGVEFLASVQSGLEVGGAIFKALSCKVVGGKVPNAVGYGVGEILLDAGVF